MLYEYRKYIIIGLVSVTLLALALLGLGIFNTSLAISTNPSGADIEINGKQYHASPITAHLLPGEYLVKASKSGYNIKYSRVQVNLFSRRVVTITLHRIPSPQEQALIDTLPYNDPHFSVMVDDSGVNNIYQISLTAILNHDWQLNQYNQDLKAYKGESLAWIKSFGLDPAKLNIDWQPPQAKGL